MLRCDNLWWIWSSFLSINFTLLILSWFLTSFFSRGTRSRFSTLAMNFVVMAYLSDKVRPILRLKLSCLSNKKNRASLDWIWIFGILILNDLGKLHCAVEQKPLIRSYVWTCKLATICSSSRVMRIAQWYFVENQCCYGGNGKKTQLS